VFAGEHTDILKSAGWSRSDVQRFLVEHTRRRLADYKRAARIPGAVTAADETTWRHIFERPDDILIACAGGRAGSWSASLPGWGNKWTRSITTRIDDSFLGRQA
jgi:alkanesulfonate monooxygenase SsuD/methylene tetrahydromethanopterin reductase-like flavin-dependent oxidoreductase (luciferase family)